MTADDVAAAFADRDAALERLGAVGEELRVLRRLHEVATERTVALAAVIEQAQGAPSHDIIRGGVRTDSVYTILASADTDAALREVRAEAWDAGFACANSPFGVDPEAPNPYRQEVFPDWGALHRTAVEGAKTDG